MYPWNESSLTIITSSMCAALHTFDWVASLWHQWDTLEGNSQQIWFYKALKHTYIFPLSCCFYSLSLLLFRKHTGPSISRCLVPENHKNHRFCNKFHCEREREEVRAGPCYMILTISCHGDLVSSAAYNVNLCFPFASHTHTHRNRQ